MSVFCSERHRRKMCLTPYIAAENAYAL